jgi:hypothetical protein
MFHRNRFATGSKPSSRGRDVVEVLRITDIVAPLKLTRRDRIIFFLGDVSLAHRRNDHLVARREGVP